MTHGNRQKQNQKMMRSIEQYDKLGKACLVVGVWACCSVRLGIQWCVIGIQHGGALTWSESRKASPMPPRANEKMETRPEDSVQPSPADTRGSAAAPTNAFVTCRSM